MNDFVFNLEKKNNLFLSHFFFFYHYYPFGNYHILIFHLIQTSFAPVKALKAYHQYTRTQLLFLDHPLSVKGLNPLPLSEINNVVSTWFCPSARRHWASCVKSLLTRSVLMFKVLCLGTLCFETLLFTNFRLIYLKNWIIRYSLSFSVVVLRLYAKDDI